MRELGTNDVFKTVIYSKYTKHERYDALDFKFSFNKSNIKSKVGSVNDINAIYFEVFPKGSKQAIVLKTLTGDYIAHKVENIKPGDRVVLNVSVKDGGFIAFEFPAFNKLSDLYGLKNYRLEDREGKGYFIDINLSEWASR